MPPDSVVLTVCVMPLASLTAMLFAMSEALSRWHFLQPKVELKFIGFPLLRRSGRGESRPRVVNLTKPWRMSRQWKDVQISPGAIGQTLVLDQLVAKQPIARRKCLGA